MYFDDDKSRRLFASRFIAAILHGRESERGSYPAFALDRMEPMRPVVDRAILELVKTSAFSGGDFLLQPDGVCRLNPELARRVVHMVTNSMTD
jgi:CRISPR-associated protein Cas1